MNTSPFRLLLPIVLASAVCAQNSTDLTELSVDDLARIQVTSASRKSESLAGAPAAIYVLTAEAIREGGFTTLPEALRSVPGLYVVQTNAHSWQVSTRGFAGIDNRKMLVLVDGRSVYSAVFGGVFWDMEDIPLETIDRIEVIRGPGGTLWGENAFNGVINIITKPADRNQAAAISTSLDYDTGYSSLIEFSGGVGSHLDYRIYGKASYWQPLTSTAGKTLPDSFTLPQAGFRADWAVSTKDSITVESTEANGVYQGYTFVGNAFIANETLKDTNVLLRWKHEFSPRSSTETLAYCDWYAHESFPNEEANTCYVELQNNLAFNARNSLIWGGSFKAAGDNSFDLTPQRRRYNTPSGFFQYEYLVVPDRLRVLFGAKFDGNPFTGIEYQPQGRAVWNLTGSQLMWAAVSRAVRAPSRSEVNLDTISGTQSSPAGTIDFISEGNTRLQSEHLNAYELGYRFQPLPALSLDVSAYYNDYRNLIFFLPVSSPPLEEVSMTLNASPAEGGTAQTHGMEFVANWQPLRRWRISPNFTETRGSPSAVSNVPRHLFGVQSRFDLAHSLYVNAALYHDNALPPTANATPGGAPLPGVPTFNRLDVGMEWRARPEWTFGLWGRNLQSAQHIEFVNDFFAGQPAELPRSLSFKLTWRSQPETSSTK